MINILLVEDQRLIREGLSALLSLESDLTIVGEAENGRLALEWLGKAVLEQLPQVILMDMRMPVMDGVAATAAITEQYPAIKVLVLTTFDDDELIAQSMAVGAQGYLLKDTPSEELALAIRSVAKGYSQFGPGIVQKMMVTHLPTSADAPSPRGSKSRLKLVTIKPQSRQRSRLCWLSLETKRSLGSTTFHWLVNGLIDLHRQWRE